MFNSINFDLTLENFRKNTLLKSLAFSSGREDLFSLSNSSKSSLVDYLILGTNNEKSFKGNSFGVNSSPVPEIIPL